MRVIPFFLLFSAFVYWFSDLTAQNITAEQVFPVEGYSVFERGFPLAVAPSDKGKFLLVEFWAEGKQGRRIDNHYLEEYGTKDFVEFWFKPVTNEGFEPMKVSEIVKLDHSIVVVGHQYIAEEKETHTVGKFFDNDGTPRDVEPTIISNYQKRSRKLEEMILTSPKKKYMLWLGEDNGTTYLSLWGDYGGHQWDKTIQLPYSEDQYRIREALLNDKGEIFFLMEYGRFGSTLKESRPLILHKFYPEEERFVTSLVEMGMDGRVMDVRMAFNQEQEVIVAGSLAATGTRGIHNGAKIEKGEDARFWTHLFCKRYAEEENVWTVKADSVSEIPEVWIKKFEEEGSNFSLSELLIFDDYATIIFEEHWVDRKKIYFYSLGVAGFDLNHCGVHWARIVEKKQRDQNSDMFLSYVSGISRGRLRLVYLSERGARGELLCTSIDMETGGRKDKRLASNEAATYLFFTKNSGMVSSYEMVLVGMGNPSLNDFKLITITF